MKGLEYDREFLASLYRQASETLLEMAAPSYLHRNPIVRWIVARRMRVVIGMLDLAQPRAVLDYGCGTGMLLLQLPRTGVRYTGVDLITWPAERFLAHHGRREAELVEASRWEALVEDGSLDYVVALEVLEHVPDLAGIVDGFRRKLKPGGRLIVSGPTENALYRVARRVAGFSGDYHEHDIEYVAAAVRASGFRPEISRSLPLGGAMALFVVHRFVKDLPAPP